MTEVLAHVKPLAVQDNAKYAGTKRRGHLPPSLRRAAATCAASALALLVSLPVMAQQGVWTTKAPMPVVRAAMAAGAIDGVLYVSPGAGIPNSAGQALLSYDPKTDTWAQKAPLPFRLKACAAVLDDKLYVMGGIGPTGSISDVEAFDPQVNAWTVKRPMPEARSDCAAGVVSGILYVAGGLGPTLLDGLFARATLWAYDPKADTWTGKAPMPTRLASAASGVIDGIFYVAGGGPPPGSTFGVSPGVYAYDPRSDSWSTKAQMPTPRSYATGAVLDGNLYVVGGLAFNSPVGYNAVEAYDPATDTWTTAPTLPTGRDELAAGVVDDVLYAVGGIGGQSPWPGLAVNEAFTPFLFVGLDIKPGEAGNTINLKSGGVVAAAILGSATFDPLTVDPETVTLAGAHVATRGRGIPMTSTRDVDHDGYPDLVLFFRTQDLQLTRASTQAVLYGTTYSDQRIRGADAVRIVPAGPASRTPARAQPAAARPRRRG